VYALHVAQRCLELGRAREEIRVLRLSIRLGNPITGTQPFDYRLNNLQFGHIKALGYVTQRMIIASTTRYGGHFQIGDISQT